MRMRKKKNLDVRLARCAPVMVDDPRAWRGRWNELFGNDHPIRLEIGCGKGRFILETARRNPDVNFVAIEREEGALIMATEKAMDAALPNLRFLSFDAAALGEIFAPGEVSLIYLNFSDPWPKARHAKRRLTYRTFLEKYKAVLADNGRIILKTDNRPLFDFSLEEFALCGMRVTEVTYDLHRSPYNEGNVMTEYEKNFSEKGFPIHRAVVLMPDYS